MTNDTDAARKVGALEQEWLDFRHCLIPYDARSDQLHAMRLAFYGGSACALHVLRHDDGPQEACFARLDAELEAFGREQADREALACCEETDDDGESAS